MDIPKFKDIAQKLNFFKSYSSLMVPAVLVLVGVLVFIPTQLMSSKLKKDMARQSISIGREVQSLSRRVVASRQWEVEQKYQQVYESDANKIALLARQSTQRQPLSYKIFPEPKDTSILIFEGFGQRFRNSVDGLITRTNAGDCPTDAELEKSLRSSISSGLRRRRGMGPGGASNILSEVDATIMDVICQMKAESASVYANPADLSGYEFWGEYEYAGVDEAVEDCWYWQLAYWIIEDVVDTVAAVNSGSRSVFTSPVKRLSDVSFTAGDSRSRTETADGRPGYVLSVEGGLTESCTGRFCNDDIDVVHFKVSVVVSAKAVLGFMEQLCSAKQHKFRGLSGDDQEQILKHNQITILESEISSIDRGDQTHMFYRYGEDAVVELDLICEYIFNKIGYDEIKPKNISE